jgi:PAS domain S-box-containing protein
LQRRDQLSRWASSERIIVWAVIGERVSGPEESRCAGESARFEMGRDLLCSVDAYGRFLWLNRAWEEVLGWSRQELMAETLVDFVHPEDVAATRRVMGRVGEADLELAEFDNRCRTKDGDWRWLRWQARTDGSTWLAVAYDVTEEKRAGQRLRAAIGEGRLLAYGEPIMEPGSGRILREELLARLESSNGGGVVTAARFIPEAERYGVIGIIDLHMAQKAVERVRLGIPTSVNVSAHTLADEALATQLVEIIGDAGQPAAGLLLEITESAAIRNLDAICELAERLSPLGCTFALDDFGTGFGSLKHLRQLPIAVLKIDREFVAGVTRRTEDRALVRSIVATAEQFRILTVAEGVEDRSTLHVVANIGVDMVQGHLIGRPHPLGPGLEGALSRVEPAG